MKQKIHVEINCYRKKDLKTIQEAIHRDIEKYSEIMEAVSVIS